MNVLAGIAPGLELETDPLPAGVAGAEDAEESTVSVQDLGRLLRCGESTVRRLIRTAVLRPVEVAGEIRVRKQDVEAYRNALAPRSPDKPGE